MGGLKMEQVVTNNVQVFAEIRRRFIKAKFQAKLARLFRYPQSPLNLDHLSTSTLYGALGRLLDQGWIERVATDDDHTGPGLPRKAYVLSRLGRRLLEAETRRLEALTATARLRLGQESV
jgi:DNA-binding HxlR family transcriptional regulator